MQVQQERYDELAIELYTNENLSEKDRMLFYKLHNEVEHPNRHALYYLIFVQRDRKGNNDRYVLSDDERKIIFDFLEKKRVSESGLNRFEYNYWSFVKWKCKLKSEGSSPCLPEILEINLSDFKEEFCINSHRLKLHEVFIKGLRRCMELYLLNEVAVMVGGSFVDKENGKPGDLDLIII